MSIATECYLQAEFALAAYSSLTAGISGQIYIDALQDSGRGMSLKQAQNFAAKIKGVSFAFNFQPPCPVAHALN